MSTIKLHNVQTGEVVEREMTLEEIEQAKQDSLRLANQAALKAELEAAKSALLEKLGISEEEAQLLLS